MRLIDADALKESILAERDKIPLKVPTAPYEFGAEKDNRHGNAMRGGIRIALRCMENTPTIKSEPVRHGRWYIPTGMTPAAHHGRHRCSVCGHMALYERPGKECLSAYCPNCFAKMDGGAE